MPEETASAIRYREASRERAYEGCAQDLIARADAIARHYVAHAVMAQQLKAILDHRNRNGGTIAGEQIIERMVREIQTNHLHDFGIPLEWNKR